MIQHKKGRNRVIIGEMEQFLGYKINNRKAFLWYLCNCYTVIDFGDDWIEFDIHTDKQFNLLKKKIREYSPDACEHNYSVDITNELWRDQRNTYWDTPIKIFERLLH